MFANPISILQIWVGLMASVNFCYMIREEIEGDGAIETFFYMVKISGSLQAMNVYTKLLPKVPWVPY